MSRTKAEIVADIKEEFMDNTTLVELYGIVKTTEKTSFDDFFSSVSLESIIINIVAFAIYVHECMFDTFKSDITTIVEEQYVMSASWYKEKALEFQNGDSLKWQQNSNLFSYGYETIDESKQLIKYCAVRDVIDSTSNVSKLQIMYSGADKAAITDADVNTAFQTYMKEIGAAGIHYDFVTLDPDKLYINATIYYDPVVLTSAGKDSEGNNVVADAINTFLNNIDYGGSFRMSDLVAAIKAVDGVKDCVFGTVDKYDSKSDTKTTVSTAIVKSVSGAFAYTEDSAYTITYTKDEME